MRNFPVNLLVARMATLGGSAENVWLEVSLMPFTLDGELIETKILLEHISLTTAELSELQEKQFRFPVNPEDGYIDGSVYIQHAHHPLDVTLLSFGALESSGLPVHIKGRLELEVEGLHDYASIDVSIQTQILAQQQPQG
jgi:hypothetical protein